MKSHWTNSIPEDCTPIPPSDITMDLGGVFLTAQGLRPNIPCKEGDLVDTHSQNSVLTDVKVNGSSVSLQEILG